MIQVAAQVSLASYSTMRIGGTAAYITEVHSRDDLKEAVAWAKERQLPMLMIGGGSNIIWRDEGYPGLIMVNRILGYSDYVSVDSHFITVGAGEIWDSVVARTVAAGLTGIEALSFIPGTAGATPVQNVGAYGQEIANVLTTVEALDMTTGQLVNIPTEACGFAYRHSNFQTEYRDRFFITAITIHLFEGNPFPPYYRAVEQYLKDNPPRGSVTPRIVRDAVIAIRQAKLPDPTYVANNGSFFANPIIDGRKVIDLMDRYPTMPTWPMDEGGTKIPAAWLIEQAGYKDYHDSETGMATWPTQPLVLVNEHAKSAKDVLAFRDKVISAVQNKFGITLTQEPEILPLN